MKHGVTLRRVKMHMCMVSCGVRVRVVTDKWNKVTCKRCLKLKGKDRW